LILEYLVKTYGEGRFKPAEASKEAMDYHYFLHYAEGSAMPPLLLKLIFSRLAKPMPFLIRPLGKAIANTVQTRFIDPQLITHTRFLEQHLASHTWFAGADFSAADVQMSFPVEGFAARGPKTLAVPHLDAFLTRIHARPAYQKALERGGPLQLMS
jgi:glutathione S-transferase